MATSQALSSHQDRTIHWSAVFKPPPPVHKFYGCSNQTWIFVVDGWREGDCGAGTHFRPNHSLLLIRVERTRSNTNFAKSCAQNAAKQPRCNVPPKSISTPSFCGAGKTARKNLTQRWAILLVVALFLVAFVAVQWQEASPEQGSNVTITQENRGGGGGHSVAGQVCEDSCEFAENGICEDGSNAGESEVQVFCDLGTDCSDCGPWITDAERAEPLPKNNVKALLDEGRDLFVRSTTTEPRFLMAYTDQKLDNDVSRQMHFYGNVHAGHTALWKTALERCCTTDPSRPGLVLDVGGNFGWYALYSAKLGCRVITWEPIPHYREYLQYGVVANKLTDLIEIRGRVVSSAGKEIFEMKYPEKGNWGLASIDGKTVMKEDMQLKRTLVTGERIDDVVAEDVCSLKVDVEGFEADVFDSARKLFKNHVVHNVFMEYTPGAWEGSKPNVTELVRLPKVLNDLLDRGYNIRHIPERIANRHNASDEILPLVKKENLVLDVQDMKDLANKTLGCSKLPKKLKQKYTELEICQRIPTALHPKSFHSAFVYNTDIWAIRDEEDFLPKDSVVGTLKPGEPLSQYFTTTGFGNGGLECGYLPAELRLQMRCPCANNTCDAKEEKIYVASKSSWGIAAFPDE